MSTASQSVLTPLTESRAQCDQQQKRHHHSHKHHHHHHHHHSTEQAPLGAPDTPAESDELVTTPVSGAETLPVAWTRTLRAVELLDGDCAAAAKRVVDAALVSAPAFVPLLLLARHLALSRPALCAYDEPSAEALRALVAQAGAPARAEALGFRAVLVREAASPTAQFLAALIEDKVGAGAARAFPAYLRAALLGCAEAQFSVGFMFTRGVGVPADCARAAAWYAKAAAAGRPNAQNNLALLYLRGAGVRRDRRRALRLLRAAAAQGHATAAHNLEVLRAQPRLRPWVGHADPSDGFALATGDTGQVAGDECGAGPTQACLPMGNGDLNCRTEEQCALNGSGKDRTRKKSWHVLALFR